MKVKDLSHIELITNIMYSYENITLFKGDENGDGSIRMVIVINLDSNYDPYASDSIDSKCELFMGEFLINNGDWRLASFVNLIQKIDTFKKTYNAIDELQDLNYVTYIRTNEHGLNKEFVEKMVKAGYRRYKLDKINL
jgi:hypothetical protein